nr:MAG TPA: hypothetical protein [Bacteriophage sp.]
MQPAVIPLRLRPSVLRPYFSISLSFILNLLFYFFYVLSIS